MPTAPVRDSEESDPYRDKNLKKDNNRRKNEVNILPSTQTLLNDRNNELSLLSIDSNFDDFIWDQIIKYATTAMIALTLLDLLSSIRGDTVQCMTPSNFTRDQGAFINSYCSQFTPPTDYFPFYLVAQATIIYGLHFLWYSWFSGKFHHFLALSTSLDRIRDSKTGDYSLDNSVISRALLDTFESSKSIFYVYWLKLILQMILSTLSIYFHFDERLFGDYSAPFVCPRDSSDIPGTWPIGSYQVPCVLTSLILLVAVRWLNIILLVGIAIIALYGLVWCLWDHKSRLNWVMVARFSFESGLSPALYVPKRYTLRYFKRRYFFKYRIRNDFDFLFLKLYRKDAGYAQVLREVLISDFIGKEEQRQFERLNLWKDMSDKEVADLKDSTDQPKHSKVLEVVNDFSDSNKAKPDKNIGNTLQSVLCNILTAESLQLEYIDAIDVSFGTTGCKLQLAAKSDHVLAVDLNPYYLNAGQPVCRKTYTSGIKYFRTLPDIFAQEENIIEEFKKQLAQVFYKSDKLPCINEETDQTSEDPQAQANVFVVGPIPSGGTQSGKASIGGSRIIAIHWLLKWIKQYRLMDAPSCLLTLKPMSIEGKDVSAHFVDFIPGQGWRRSQVVMCRGTEGNTYKLDASRSNNIQDIVTIRCGWSNCDFKIIIYCREH